MAKAKNPDIKEASELAEKIVALCSFGRKHQPRIIGAALMQAFGLFLAAHPEDMRTGMIEIHIQGATAMAKSVDAMTKKEAGK